MLDNLLRFWRSEDSEQDLEAGNHVNDRDHFTRIPRAKSNVPRRDKKHPKLQLNTSNISAPMRRSPHSITGMDIDGRESQWHSSPLSSSSSRSGPSSIAWLRPQIRSSVPEESSPDRHTAPTRPAAARLGMMVHHPLSRSVSSPAATSSSSTSSQAHNQSHPHSSGKVGMHQEHVGSTHSLRAYHSNMLYGDAYSYPVKPLSPIAEQDYFSPEALGRTVSLPPDGTSISVSTSAASPLSAAASQSTRDRQSPIRSTPFITRSVNRSLSQRSQGSHRSGLSTSSVTPVTPIIPVPPVLPVLDLRPPFPGPHPTQEGDGPPLRPRKHLASAHALPTIDSGSDDEEYEEEYGDADEEEYGEEGSVYGGEDDEDPDSPASLHPESFVTASDNSHRDSRRLSAGSDAEVNGPPTVTVPISAPVPLPAPVAFPPGYGGSLPIQFTSTDVSMIRSESTRSHRSPPSTSESFIFSRWNRKSLSSFPSRPRFSLKPKRQCFVTNTTPAFWAFWLGVFLPILCPVFWMLGGWHFTHFGEQPARLGFWEFYFNAGYWREVFCCGRGKLRWPSDGHAEVNTVDLNGLEVGSGNGKRKRKRSKGKGKLKEKVIRTAPVPRWITEKQSTDVKKARLNSRLNDPKRSLKGILIGYPFVPRPVPPLPPLPPPCPNPEPQSPSRTPAVPVTPRTRQAAGRIRKILCKPNRFFDHFYGVRLTDVRGKREGPRRMFDPWIQRCRYAFCYAMVVVLAGLATGATRLVIASLRDFR